MLAEVNKQTSDPSAYYAAQDAWVQTYTGIAYPFLEPHPDYIDIEDIAQALSKQCRFSGHVREFYSVAQHCVIGSYHVPAEYALEFLMHDATEAYLVDIPRPIKYSGWVGRYIELEELQWKAIAEKFNLAAELPKCVKEVDNRMLMTEQRDLMGRQAKPWADKAEPLEKTIYPVPPLAAYIQFIARFKKLMRERKQSVA